MMGQSKKGTHKLAETKSNVKHLYLNDRLDKSHDSEDQPHSHSNRYVHDMNISPRGGSNFLYDGYDMVVPSVQNNTGYSH